MTLLCMISFLLKFDIPTTYIVSHPTVMVQNETKLYFFWWFTLCFFFVFVSRAGGEQGNIQGRLLLTENAAYLEKNSV